MATRSIEQNPNSFGQILSEGFALTGARIAAGLRAMGPLGRRFALTGIGAATALALGAGTASAFRLPAEATDAAAPQDQTLALDELPSQAAASANALANPPAYPITMASADTATDPALTAAPDAGGPEANDTATPTDYMGGEARGAVSDKADQTALPTQDADASH